MNRTNDNLAMDEFEARQTVANFVALMGFNANAIALPAGYTWNAIVTELYTHTGRMALATNDPAMPDEPDKVYEGLPAAQAFIALMRAANGVRS